jgi:enoyl-CoA hydratase/carnithine racemase
MIRSAESGGNAAPVSVTVESGVAHVVLNRPEKKNALNADLFNGLLEAASRIEADKSVRAVVLSGAGRNFSSGLDISSLGEIADGSLDAGSGEIAEAARDLSKDGANRAQQLAWRWVELPVPVIAAVEGVALGGGFHIALGADIRIVATDACIGFVEILWGLVPDLSGTQSLRRLVPLDVAKDLIFSGRTISGEEAVALNLCTRSGESPVKDALELARELATRSPEALRAAKRLLNESALVPLAEGLGNEMKASSALMGTANQVEAVMARLEKRLPRFADPA